MISGKKCKSVEISLKFLTVEISVALTLVSRGFHSIDIGPIYLGM
jgi:hypothetical protein